MNFTFLPWSTFHRTGPCSAHQRGSQPGNPHTSSETKHQVTGVWVKMQNSSWNPLPDKLILILIELRSELKSIFYIGSDRTVMSHYIFISYPPQWTPDPAGSWSAGTAGPLQTASSCCSILPWLLIF